ncbi:MAG TPA: metalloregulator ArsR/SmtB family transcription factor [Ruminiclostridium sp.]|nr:metalloregulator ArsR/SmtB family transcription factor [Ruminiclostridium sp.]
MEERYEYNAKLIKALSDPGRLKIIDILSCGEQCACSILEKFNFTQPTLSHHMKVLTDCGLVKSRKEGLWNHYTLDTANCNKLILFLTNLAADTDDCICKKNTTGDIVSDCKKSK